MRKLLTLTLLAITLSLSAQDRLMKPEMYVGVNFGATESQIMFNPTIKQGYLQGYNGGLVFRYIAEKNVGMQAELNFSQRGWKEATGAYTRQLNYIELPFMTHIYMGKRSRFFINIGPKISYLISDKLVLNQTTIAAPQYSKIQNPFDYGLCGGLGLLFTVGGNIIQLDTRLNYGLSSIYSNKKTDYFSNANNFDLSVNLAWLLKIQ